MKTLWVMLAIVLIFGFTGNWPHEPLIGNVPTGEAVMWTGVSILLLRGGIRFIVWLYAAFWAMNGGLMAMIVLSLLPVGLLQTVVSVKHGYWYSRSGEFLGQGLRQPLRWTRMPGDTLFAIGAVAVVVFVFGLGFGYSLEDEPRALPGAAKRPA
jgi:nitric oxide reductase large subunit